MNQKNGFGLDFCGYNEIRRKIEFFFFCVGLILNGARKGRVLRRMNDGTGI